MPSCFACCGPYHPATGHLYREWDIAFCGRCYGLFLAWLSGHLCRRWGGHRFYDEAATSIIAGGRRSGDQAAQLDEAVLL